MSENTRAEESSDSNSSDETVNVEKDIELQEVPYYFLKTGEVYFYLWQARND